MGYYIPREENGNPSQYSCLEIPTDRGAWWATFQGVTKSQTQLSDIYIKVIIIIFIFQRDGMGREEGGGFRMGNTCKPVADSF